MEGEIQEPLSQEDGGPGEAKSLNNKGEQEMTHCAHGP